MIWRSFTSSGFTAVVRTKTPPQPLTEVRFSWIDRGANSGQIVFKPEKLAGAVTYEVHYGLVTNGAVGPWTTLTLTDTKKVTINGLTPAGSYQFQIRALGKLGYSDWMDTRSFICA